MTKRGVFNAPTATRLVISAGIRITRTSIDDENPTAIFCCIDQKLAPGRDVARQCGFFSSKLSRNRIADDRHVSYRVSDVQRTYIRSQPEPGDGLISAAPVSRTRDAVERAAGTEARDAADPRRGDDTRQRRPDTDHAAPQESAQFGHEPVRGVAGAVRPSDWTCRRSAGRRRRERTVRTLAARLPRRLLPHRHPSENNARIHFLK